MATRARRARAICIILTAVFLSSTAEWTPPPVAASTGLEINAPLGVPAEAPLPARPGVELVERRTATSDTFDNGNGTLTTTLYSEPVYYQPPGKTAFEPILVGFLPASGAGDPARISDRAPVAVQVAPATDARGFVSVSAAGHTIRLLPPSVGALSPVAAAEPVADGPVADQAEVLPGVGLRVLARADGAHNFFVLDEPADAAALTFVIEAPGLSLKPEPGGAWLFVDDAGATVARMPQPYALDSSPDTTGHGSGRLTMDVGLSIEGFGSPWVATLTLDPTWLAEAVYPVYVDPTFIFDTTSEVADAHVSSAYPTANFGNYCRPDSPFYCELWFGLDPGGLSGEDRDYIQFDTTPIVNTTIDLAMLEIYPYHQYYNAPTQITSWVDRVNTSWTEPAITWNNKPTSHTAIGSFTSVEGQTASFVMTSTVQGWASGTLANFGIRLWCNGCGVTSWKRFISSEQGGGNVPKLVVDYHTPVATIVEPTGWTADPTVSWSYSDAVFHAQSHYHVDVASDAGFSSIISTSGDVASAATSWTIPVSLTNGTTYWWRVRVKDGTSWSPWASMSFGWDASYPSIGNFTQPPTEPTFVGSGATTWTVAWPQVTAPSGITDLVIHEERGSVVTTGSCAGVSYAETTNWALAPTATSTSISTAGKVNGSCYRYWLEALSGSGNWAFGPDSNAVLFDTTAPSVAFTAPPAGTTITSIPPVVAWTESDAASGVLSRSLQRQRASITSPGVCSASWSSDGSATTTASPTPQTTLVGWCYRWQLSVTDRANNTTALTSGVLIRDPAANLGAQRQHSFESWDLGAGDSLAVNVATGNLVLSHPIVSLPIRGSSVSLALTYNGQDAASVGMGAGWRLNVFRRLTINADNSVTFVDADGARYTYTNPVVNGTVTTYTRPASLYATLVKDTAQSANEFVLTYRDLSKDKFDILGSEGILVRAEDRFANGVTLAYTPGTNRISTLSDTAGGRTIDLAWDGSNRLTTITDWAWIDGSGVVQTGATGARRTYRFFYDASSRLAGWSNPLNTAGSCPTGGSHLTCIAYPTNGLDVSKTQTVTTAGASALTTSTRTITTKVTFAGSDVASVKDAQQVADAGLGTTIAWSSPTLTVVTRPTTITGYALVSQNDAYGRIQSVVRVDSDHGVEIEQRTTWNATYPTEPASVTDNYGALLSTPARTVSYTYVASSLGLLAKQVEPLTATTNRWTEYVYNANNDVSQRTVSLDGSATKTVTRYCYSTQSLTCPTTETGLTLVRRIDNWVSGGAQDDDTNVATDYTSDAYGRQIRVTRHNRDAAGAVRDDRVDAFVFDAANLGNLVTEIRNYVDGVVTNGSLDTNPGADSVRTDLTTVHTYDTAGNRVSSADPRRAIGLAIPATSVVTFSPTDDAHVRDANPTTNYGADPTLQVRATGGSQGAYEPYLRFTVTGLVGTVTNATLRLQNTATSNIAAPSQRVKGALVTSLNAITVAPDPGHVAGDVELLFVETTNEPATLTTAAGFVQVPGTGVGTGTAGGTTGTRMTVFWRRWNGTDGSPVVADSGNHQSALIISYQGVVDAGSPWDVVGTNQQSSSTTAGSAAGVTTSVASTLLVIATAGAQPDASGSTEFSGWTNANLASLTERHDVTVTTGNGSSLAIADGLKAAAGATGATTFTTVTSTTKDNVVIALKAGTRDVCAYRVPDTTWTEGAITWTTKPASDPGSITCVSGSQAAGPIDFNLATNVPGPGLWAFRLTNSSATEVTYGSKEHATLGDPQLLVTVGYGPLGADDYVTRWTYAALNERLTERTPTTYGISIAQKTSSSIYDELGALRQATDFGGIVTGTEFDRAGRATKTYEDTDGAGATAPATTSIATYDADGHPLTVKDRNQVANSALGSTRNEYDSLGRLELATDAYGSSPDVASDILYGYDALDRQTLLSIGGLDTVTEFDLGGRVTKTDDDFTCSTATYDYRDLALTVTSGLAGGTCASAANTRTVTNSFDGLGRQFRAEVTAGAGSGDRTQDDTLDSAGNRLTAAARKSGVTTTTTFTVTKLDQTIAEVRPDGSTSKTTYDPAANAADRCFWKPGISVGDCKVVGTSGWTNPPSQSTSSTFDARNSRIQQVDGLTNGITTYDSDHNYQPEAIYLPTSSGRELQTLYLYDTRHRLTGITQQLCVVSSPSGHTCSSTTPAGSDTYLYDDNDNRTTVNESNGATSSDRRYCYDARNQLLYRNTAAACSSSAKDEANTYDDAGNRLTGLVGATTTNFAYTVDGQLCDVETAPTAASCSGGNLTYDTAGRTLTYAGWTFAYDSQGRLTSACKSPTCAAGFDKVEFSYDGENHRTQLKTTSAAGAVATRDFRYQGAAIVEERLTDAGHPSGTVVRSYVVDDAGSTVKLIVPAGEPDAGTYLVTWSGHGDALALWRQNADGTLTLANSFTYETWGKPSTATHNGSADLGFRFLYVGEFDVQWDDAFGLGLAYMHARHYAPALGRFLQPDPDRSETNLYAYTANNPVTEIDPAGTCFILCAVIGAVIDTAIYLATTDRSEWSVAGVATAAVVGAVTGFVGVGLLSKVAKIGAVARAVSATRGVASRAISATRGAASRGASAVARAAIEVPFKHPNVMRYVSPNVGQRIGELAGWTIRGSARGVGERTGLGLRIMERARDGINFTGRQLRWHPGGGHHGPQPYWRVLQPNGPTPRIYQ